MFEGGPDHDGGRERLTALLPEDVPDPHAALPRLSRGRCPGGKDGFIVLQLRHERPPSVVPVPTDEVCADVGFTGRGWINHAGDLLTLRGGGGFQSSGGRGRRRVDGSVGNLHDVARNFPLTHELPVRHRHHTAPISPDGRGVVDGLCCQTGVGPLVVLVVGLPPEKERESVTVTVRGPGRVADQPAVGHGALGAHFDYSRRAGGVVHDRHFIAGHGFAAEALGRGHVDCTTPDVSVSEVGARNGLCYEVEHFLPAPRPFAEPAKRVGQL